MNNDNINKQIPMLRAKLIKQMNVEKSLENGVTSNSVCEFKLTRVNKHGENKVKVVVEMVGEQNPVEIDLDREDHLNKKFCL